MSRRLRGGGGAGVTGGASPLPRVAAFVAAATLVVALDQLSKALVRGAAPQLGRFGTLVPGLVDLVHVENTGAAFSMGEGAGPLFVAIALVVVAAALAVVVREPVPLPLAVALGGVAGGGVGNLIDRVVHGSVTDFLAVTFVDFPVFNVADIFVTCGVIAAVVGFYLLDRREAQSA